jgi:putative DNA primase/helicase
MKNLPPSARLREIVRIFGGVLLDNGLRALIPGPGHSRTDRSVSLRQLPDGRILIHCFSPKDDWRAVAYMLRDYGVTYGACDTPVSATTPSTEIEATYRKIDRARALWAEALPIAGTLAETYLRARRIDLDVWPSSLRFLPRATSIEDRRRRPALISAITSLDGGMQGIQITLLSPCGAHKAALETPRRVLGRLKGGAVRLQEAEAAGQLIIAEGLETALSASVALGFPAWAALSAGNLARFTPPMGLTRLLIAADRGPAGEAAAESLTRNMASQSLPATILFAPGRYPDWNDWAQRKA